MDRLIAMEVFVTVVDEKSLTAAARKLDISRSMATRHIAALEKSLGVRLLHRSTRSLGITSNGEELLPFCRSILQQTEQLYHLAQHQHSALDGKITIACSISFGQLYLAQSVERFLELYPNVSVDLHIFDRPVDAIKEGVDIAIETGNKLPEQLIGRRLANFPSVVCATPEYLKSHGVLTNPEDLLHHNCLVHKRLGVEWNFVDKTNPENQCKVKVKSNYSVNDTTILLKATLAGRGLCCLPLPDVRDYLQEGSLQVVLDDYHVNQLGIWALYASRQFQPKLHRLFLDFLVDDLKLATQY
ncbi:LysR family transcriptional regulator [Vibrio sp. YIC-376]|uniref:LysR family transcriptional regulator n=1 Tax=Vibrio sp. YIC-376 TaxID=3136162 RepID=UPI00402AF4E3